MGASPPDGPTGRLGQSARQLRCRLGRLRSPESRDRSRSPKPALKDAQATGARAGTVPPGDQARARFSISCSWPTAARPIWNTAQDAASTIGAATSTTRRSMAASKKGCADLTDLPLPTASPPSPPWDFDAIAPASFAGVPAGEAIRTLDPRLAPRAPSPTCGTGGRALAGKRSPMGSAPVSLGPGPPSPAPLLARPW